MTRFIVYGVNSNDGEPTIHYGTKSEALRDAQRFAREVTPEGEECIVERITLVPMTKTAIVRLLNIAGGYVDESTVIARFPSKKVQS